MANQKPQIALCYGDGSAAEIMDSVMTIMKGAGTNCDFYPVEMGQSCFLKGIENGIPKTTELLLQNCHALLKAPIIAPTEEALYQLRSSLQRMLKVTGSLSLCRSYSPFLMTKYPGMDFVIAYDAEEQLYSPREYHQTQELTHSLHYCNHYNIRQTIYSAFEYARRHLREKISCITSPIARYSDALFREIFQESAKEYPDLETEHLTLEEGCRILAKNPEYFDVIALPGDHGALFTSIAKNLTGNASLAPMISLSDHCPLFQIDKDFITSGEELSNPSGLLLAAVMMLESVGEADTAMKIGNAYLKTIEEGVHTHDLFDRSLSKIKVNVAEFTKMVCEFLGDLPQQFTPMSFIKKTKIEHLPTASHEKEKRELVGVDIFIASSGSWEKISSILQKTNLGPFELCKTASSHEEGDEWQCRFIRKMKKEPISFGHIITLLEKLKEHNMDVVHMENLYYFNNRPRFSA